MLTDEELDKMKVIADCGLNPSPKIVRDLLADHAQLAAQLDEARREIEKWKKGAAQENLLLEQGKLHRISCNNKHGLVGDPGCSCPTGRTIGALQADLDAARARNRDLEAAQEPLRLAAMKAKVFFETHSAPWFSSAGMLAVQYELTNALALLAPTGERKEER